MVRKLAFNDRFCMQSKLRFFAREFEISRRLYQSPARCREIDRPFDGHSQCNVIRKYICPTNPSCEIISSLRNRLRKPIRTSYRFIAVFTHATALFPLLYVNVMFFNILVMFLTDFRRKCKSKFGW